MKTTFPLEVRELALKAAFGFCQCSEGCVEKATEFHHKLSNTKVNQRLYPLFLQSIFNCCPIAHGCHMTKPLPRISDAFAYVYEEYLKKFFTPKVEFNQEKEEVSG